MTHDPSHDPHTGKPRAGMARLYGTLDLEGRIKHCERLLNEGHEAQIEALLKRGHETLSKWNLHYVTVMPDVLAWTRAEHSRLLALRKDKAKRR